MLQKAIRLSLARRRRQASRRTSLRLAALLALAAFNGRTTAQQPLLLRPGATVQLAQASIWGGISYNGANISITTVFAANRPQLFLRKVDRDMKPVGAIVQLTSDADPESLKRITDHKHLFLNQHHFIAFSVAGDSALYLLKVDKEGRRVGPIVAVIENTANRTNDMMLTSDGERLYVAYFKPNDQSVVHVLDQDLRQVQPPMITSPQLPHNNLGGLTYNEGRFYMFTGDKAGPNSNLILTIWNRDWTPAQPERKILIPAPAGGGYFFATGMAFDPSSRRWYLGFHHVLNSDPDGTTHLDVAVFDASFKLLEHQHGEAGFRPHFLLLDGVLYMVYDRGGVFLMRYDVTFMDAPPSGRTRLIFPTVIRSSTRETGIALVNPSEITARVTAEAFSDNGTLLSRPGMANPAELWLAPKAQLARVTAQIFGDGFFTEGSWLRLSSDLPDMHGFFQAFDPGLEVLDGAPAGEKPLGYWVLPVLENAEIALVNPDEISGVEVLLRFFDLQGGGSASATSLILPPRGRKSGALSSFIPATGTAQGYLQGMSYGVGVVAAARFGKPGRHESVLNSLDANASGTLLLAPQYAAGEGYRSSIVLLNLEMAETVTTFELLDNQGRAMASSLQIRLPARGITAVNNSALLGRSATSLVQGYVRITSSATRLAGATLIGDDAGERFQTALPLMAEGFSEALVAQIADTSQYFTGLAAVNLAVSEALVTASAFQPDGQLVGTGTRTLGAGARFSLLLRELIPELPAMSGGYITLRASQPVAAFAVFGTRSLAALSALAAQPVVRPAVYGAGGEADYCQVNTDSDFVPPKGGVPGGPGPVMVRLMAARSAAGSVFERTGKIVADQGAVPDMVVEREGTIYQLLRKCKSGIHRPRKRVESP